MDLKLTVQYNELFPVYLTGLNNQAVSLRDVHATLGAGKNFNAWVKAKVKEHRLTENQDFVIYTLEEFNSGKRGRKRKDYVTPLKIAKMIAMGVNTEAGDVVKEYFLRCESIAHTAISQQHAPQPEPLRLTDFTQPQVQVQCVKRVASALYDPTNNPEAIMEHHRETCKLLTGFTPSAYVRSFVAKGLRVASFSARKLMRRVEPDKACTAAFIDDARTRGRSPEQLAAAGVIEALPQAFAALLKAGYSLEELGA